MVDQLPRQQWITDSYDLQVSKFNFNALIIRLEQFFSKIVIIFCLSLSKTTIQQSCLKIYQ